MRIASASSSKPAATSNAVTDQPSASRVYADGQLINLDIAMQAAEWLTTLMSGQVTSAEKKTWTSWRQSHPDHERAWKHIEKVSGNFQGLDGQASRQVLTQRPMSRRKGLKMLLWLSSVGLVSWAGMRTETARTVLADISTGVGQRRELTLADGSQLHLNGSSAVNIRYTNTQRLLQLVKGELFVATAQEADQSYRPFLVETTHGQALALGTRYSVRQEEKITTVAVQQGMVKITPRSGGTSVIINAGQSASMTSESADAAQSVSANAWGWMRGQILADGMPLRDFLNELSRYRHGFLGCEDAIADLRISGVFPLDDTEAVLLSLANSLPVRIRFRTRYWVQVEELAAS